MLKQGITVHNAGIILLNAYIPMLFERLYLIKNTVFNSEENQQEAIHFLQYLVTGQSQTEESFLSLNKILCGFPLQNSIRSGIEISEDDKNLMNGLIQAVIGYWPAIGETSIDGFRGNWLVREGVLKEEKERWELIVEKRAYDILLMKCPFSFSIIKYPWMDKPLQVTWPF